MAVRGRGGAAREERAGRPPSPKPEQGMAQAARRRGRQGGGGGRGGGGRGGRGGAGAGAAGAGGGEDGSGPAGKCRRGPVAGAAVRDRGGATWRATTGCASGQVRGPSNVRTAASSTGEGSGSAKRCNPRVGESRPRTVPPGPASDRSWDNGSRNGRIWRETRLASNDEVPKVVDMGAVVRCNGGSATQSRRGAGSRPTAGGAVSGRLLRRDHTGVIPRSKAAG